MNYWLLKTEPNTYSIADLEKDKKTSWDGVRNFQARNNLKLMKKGDLALIYHSGDERAIVGLAEVLVEHYPDPRDDSEKFVAVDVLYKEKFSDPLSLKDIKADEALKDLPMLKQSRLSVCPVTKAQWSRLVHVLKS